MIDTRFYEDLGPMSLGDLIAGLDIQPLLSEFLEEEVIGVADLAKSGAHEIGFLASKKYKTSLETARATACLLPEDCAPLAANAHIIPLISKTPRAHFGRIINRLVKERSIFDVLDGGSVAESAKIHPTAVVSPSAVLHENVQISPYAVIGPGVVVGARSRIGSHVSVECSIIGEDCTLNPGCSLGTRGFGVDGDEAGLLDLPHIGRVILGDRVSIGSQTTVDRGFLGDTQLADDVKIDNLVQIAHNVTVGAGTVMAGHVGVSGSCHIGKNVMLGGSVGLADHLTIGDGARLAARAGVMHDVPAGETWSGIPAMPIRDHMRLISATRKLVTKKKV